MAAVTMAGMGSGRDRNKWKSNEAPLTDWTFYYKCPVLFYFPSTKGEQTRGLYLPTYWAPLAHTNHQANQAWTLAWWKCHSESLKSAKCRWVAPGPTRGGEEGELLLGAIINLQEAEGFISHAQSPDGTALSPAERCLHTAQRCKCSCSLAGR